MGISSLSTNHPSLPCPSITYHAHANGRVRNHPRRPDTGLGPRANPGLGWQGNRISLILPAPSTKSRAKDAVSLPTIAAGPDRLLVRHSLPARRRSHREIGSLRRLVKGPSCRRRRILLIQSDCQSPQSTCWELTTAAASTIA